MFEVKEKCEKHLTEHDNRNFTIYSEQELICMIEKDLGILKRKKRNVSEMDYTNIIENVPNSEEEEEEFDCYYRTFPGYFVFNNDYI